MIEAIDCNGRKLVTGDVVIVSAGGTSVAEFGIFSHATEKRLMVKMPGSGSRPFYWTQKSPATVCKFVPELATETLDRMMALEKEHERWLREKESY